MNGAQTFVKTDKCNTEIIVPTLDDRKEGVKGFREVLKGNLGNLVFRRVTKVIAYEGDYICTEKFNVDMGGNIVSGLCKKGEIFTDDEKKRKVLEHYANFAIFTSHTSIRKENDNVKGEIYGNSQNYADFDLFDFEFHPQNRTLLPRVGDLVCGAVNVTDSGAQYAYWFVCSEQFLRFWTLVMFDKHESFDKILEKKGQTIDEETLRRKVLSGNHLMTNGFRKWMLSVSQTQIDGKTIVSEPEENEKRFWTNRTEAASAYVHVYCCLILILKYMELPCESNVPNNINDGPYMIYWDLPEGWLENLCLQYSLYPQYKPRTVTFPLVTTLPKGTKFVDVPLVEVPLVDVPLVEVPFVAAEEQIYEVEDGVCVPFQNFDE